MSDSLAGMMRDKLFLAKAMVLQQADVKTAVVKATNHDPVAPKEKHVQTLLTVAAGHSGDYTPSRLAKSLSKRLAEPEWVVVLKTLVVFHRLFNEAAEPFADSLVRRKDVFYVGSFLDQTTPEAFAQTQFIRRYGRYLEEKVFVYSDMSMLYSTEFTTATGGVVRGGGGRGKGPQVASRFVNMPESDLVLNTKRLSSHMDMLLDIPINDNAARHFASLSAIEMLIRESVMLYRILSDAILHVLEVYFSMNKTNAKTSLAVYKRYIEQVDRLIQLYTLAKNWDGIEPSILPSLKKPSQDLVSTLEEYANESVQTGSLSDLGVNPDRLRSSTPTLPISSSFPSPSSSSPAVSTPSPTKPSTPAPAPAANANAGKTSDFLIDFFDAPVSSPAVAAAAPSPAVASMNANANRGRSGSGLLAPPGSSAAKPKVGAPTPAPISSSSSSSISSSSSSANAFASLDPFDALLSSIPAGSAASRPVASASSVASSPSSGPALRPSASTIPAGMPSVGAAVYGGGLTPTPTVMNPFASGGASSGASNPFVMGGASPAPMMGYPMAPGMNGMNGMNGMAPMNMGGMGMMNPGAGASNPFFASGPAPAGGAFNPFGAAPNMGGGMAPKPASSTPNHNMDPF